MRQLIAQTIKTANPSIPIMTIDADLAKEDAALRKTYLGTDNYLMGYKIGEYIKKGKPNGGKICTIEGNPAPTTSCAVRRACATRFGQGRPCGARRRRRLDGSRRLPGVHQ